jgi:hypothetical protein
MLKQTTGYQRTNAAGYRMNERRTMTEPPKQSRWIRAMIIVLAVAVIAATAGSLLIAVRLMK